MYEKDISRTDPGCIVVLLDRSDSMNQQWRNSQHTLAEGAASALNKILLEVCFRAQGEPGKARHYFDIGIFGYGFRPIGGGEGVEPAFGGALAGRPLVALPELWDSPIAVRKSPPLIPARRRAGCQSGWSPCTGTGHRCVRRSPWRGSTSTSG